MSLSIVQILRGYFFEKIEFKNEVINQQPYFWRLCWVFPTS
jgi:hypothetical protein